MQSFSRTSVIALMILIIPLVAAAEPLILKLTHLRRPARGFTVIYHDFAETVSTQSDSLGRAVFDIKSDPGALFVPYSLELASTDYVLTKLHGSHFRWAAVVARSATWRLRSKPRRCDEWLAVIDIPRGALQTQTSDDVDSWYESLSPRLLANCETLHRIEQQVGSKAPWYFYQFKAMPSACDSGGEYRNELDWTAWYRGMLEEATGASPGKCVSDWERWWSEKGYEAIPDQTRQRITKR
jgi:hypothetical protein